MVLDFATRRVQATWLVPGGGSPDLGNVSADGRTLWLSGRFDDVVYVFDTRTGDMTTIPVEAHGYPRVNLLQWGPGRLLTDPRLRRAVQAVSVGLLALVVVAGFAGDQTPTRNLAPIWVWVVWWVGLAYVSALVGNVWIVLNPWAALFGWVEGLARKLGGTDLALKTPYPRRLGLWPAAVLFAAFAWLELVYAGRAVPAQLAFMTIVYSLITWTGCSCSGAPCGCDPGTRSPSRSASSRASRPPRCG